MESFDFIVVGSGFGGSVAAHKLTEAGAKVALIERGPWRDTAPNQGVVGVPKSPLPYGKYFYSHLVNKVSMPLFKKPLTLNARGLYELYYQKDMTIACSSGVGGGSHVYSAMNVRPAVDGYWQSILAEDANSMESHYQWMIGKMGATHPNKHCPSYIGNTWQNSDSFKAHSKQPAMSISGGDDDKGNNSFLGSPTGTKATLDKVLLQNAQQQGLVIHALHECKVIEKHHSKNNDFFLVKCLDYNAGRYRFFKAKKVILAAGTLNTVRLLFSSRDQGGLAGMPALGYGFVGNGDFPAYWPVNKEAANFMNASPCHGRLGLVDQPDAPNITTYGFNGFENIPFPKRLKARLKKDLILVGMGADQNLGMFTWNKRRLGVRYLHESQPILKQIKQTFDAIGELSGTKVIYTNKRYLTVHPLGGAIAGVDSQHSVVNLSGEVHGVPGLYVADGAALPKAPGSPPSMTIAAWSAYVSQQLVANR